MITITPELQAYLDCADKRPVDYHELKRLKSLVDPQLLTDYFEHEKNSYFVVEGSNIKTYILSDKYTLTIGTFETKKGCWNYSQGKVFENGKSDPIAIVNRNYKAFPYLFVNHTNGFHYFVCGADYQGQTVIELETGKRKDLLSDGSDNGFGFCWADYEFNQETKILIVNGCYWGAPYEYKLFDFSDPMNGWPEIEILEDEELLQGKKPEVTKDYVKSFETRYPLDYDYDEDDESKKSVVETKTFKWDNKKLLLCDHWIDEEEVVRRKIQEEKERAWEEKINLFKKTDPLYLKMVELVSDSRLNPESGLGYGQTYDGWCPGFSGHETRLCRRIKRAKNSKGWTVDLSWGIDTAPIKLELYKDGKTFGNKVFEHSVQGMIEAFDYVFDLK